MRKVMLMGALVALLVTLFAAAAFARDFQCTTIPCEGTNNRDTITERAGNVNDNISGKRGGDTITATAGTNDRDDLFGNRGDDTLNADDGDPFDSLNGGAGRDVCRGDDGDTFTRCEVIYIDGVLQ
jgi:Ca2+-binding RTX toxin-like protein